MFYNARWYDPALGRFAQADSIVPPGVQGLDRYAYVNNNPMLYTDPTGHDVDCGIGDSYCDEANREYHYSWRMYSKSSFKTYLRAKDAYDFYYKHPDIALKDYFANTENTGSWADVDSYTLASTYSENIKHQLFNPVGDDYILREIDRIHSSGEDVDPYYISSLLFGLFITFGPDGGGGGGIGSIDDNINQTLKLIDAGGPFPFKQDGQIFQNRKEPLPPMTTGYYHEYTVITPGVSNRGTVRIVTGQNGEAYLTINHYKTFIRIR